ncbi:hypothetical protein R0J90_14790, partial [Micrococcus sp. SIMBA_144]
MKDLKADLDATARRTGATLLPACGHHVAAAYADTIQVSPRWDIHYARRSSVDSALAARMPEARDTIAGYTCQFCQGTIAFLEHWQKIETDA